MGEKCKPYYKNLNTIQSYSEQKYATVQWCEQNCMNDEWLRRQVEQLKYLSPPAVRKRFPIEESVDFKHSYGCTVTGTHKVGFDNSLTKEYSIYFEETDDLKVDDNHTTAVIVNNTEAPTSLDSNDGELTATGHRCQLPTTTETLVTQDEEQKTFGTINGDKGVNSAWYVAWDKSKPYYVRPDWLKNWRDGEIKSVCRGQTFKAEYTGTLWGVDLKLDWNGSKVSNCGSPLYVQIWNTYNRFLAKTYWDNTKKTMIYKYINYATAVESDSRYANKQRYKKVEKNKKKLNKYGQVVKDKKGNVVYVKDKKGNIVKETAYVKDDNGEYVRKRENVKWLGHNFKNPKWTGKDDTTHKKWLSDISHPLAEAEYDKVGDTFPTIQFDKPCKIVEGESYAIVMFSPLSEWKHCPRIGGWGRNCKKDKVYPYGSAFMSSNNGRKWIRYGKNGADMDSKGKVLEYKKGRYTPQDFAFQCRVRTKEHEEIDDTTFDLGEHIVQFEPIYSNPITRLTVNTEQHGTASAEDGLGIIYEVSTDGDVWSEINPNTRSITFEKDENEEYPTCVLLRAVLWRGENTSGKETPYIDNIIIRLDTLPSKELYARTVAYAPRTNAMLGANVWGRIHAPFTTEPTVDCNVEIIKGNTVTEHYTIIEVGKVRETMEQLDLDVTDIPIVTPVPVPNNNEGNTESSGESDDSDNVAYLEIASYLTNHTDVLDVLKKNNILVKPFEYNNYLFMLSFAYSYTDTDLIITKDATDSDSSTSGSTDTIFNEVAFNVGGIPLSNDVAYPLCSVQIQPSSSENGSSVASFSEILDYRFDYEENMLIFKKTTIDDLISGDLSITYNPIFLKRLTNLEVGKRIDEETGLPEEGIILDYFKETITITEENIETRRVKLRVQPTDPIREVKLYRYNDDDSDNAIELFEGFDFELDLDTNELVFEISNMDGVSSVLGLNDTLTVVYTPWLEDDKLYLGYYATRGEINRQVSIQNYYMEYKA